MAVELAAVLGYNVGNTEAAYFAEDSGTLKDAESIALWMNTHLQAGDAVILWHPAMLDCRFRLHNMPAAAGIRLKHE